MRDILDLFNNENRYCKMVDDIIRAIESHSLFLFIGAGVSIGQGYPDWNKYVDELLRYWTYRLSDLNKDRPAKREDLLFLNYIAESNMDKKRKIDIVHYLIKEYQIDVDKVDSKLLEFERMYFREMEPIERINSTLKELVKLEATFITTNYDNQIEEHFSRQWGRGLEVYENVSELNERVPANSIIYLHGHPDGNPNYFINSSSSYSRLYYEENKSFNNFRKFLQTEVNPTILFIGCSMEEEEILAFLNKQHHTKDETKYYALMRYDNQPSSAEPFNEHMYQFYKNEKNIELIWYGESHKQLPILVKDLVSRVKGKLTSEKERDLQAIKSGGLNTVSVLNNAKDTNNFYFLTEIFKHYLKAEEQDVLNFYLHLFNSKIITQGALKNAADYASLWQLLATRYELLNDVSENKLFDFITSIETLNSEAALSLGRFVLQSKYNDYQGKKKYLVTIYKSMNWYSVLKELDDDELFCLYFSELLAARNRVWIEKTIYKDQLIFNYNNESFDDLLRALEKLNRETRYYGFEYNMVHSNMSLLFNCIKEGLLQYEGTYEFPDNFYEVKVIQKIFVNLDLKTPDQEKFEVLAGQIEKVKNKIDYTDPLMGKEMNEFFAIHSPDSVKEKGYFIDGISTSETSSIEFYPYLNISELFSLSNEDIVHTLENSSNIVSHDDKGFSKSKYVSGQSDTFDELFTGEGFEKYTVNMEEILILLIENDVLRQRYGPSINKYFMNSEERILENKDILQLYLKKIRSNNFTWLEKKIYEYIISRNLYLELDFFNKLFTAYDVTQFEPEEITDETGFVDINKFINTSIGRFFDVFQLLEQQSDLSEHGYDQLLNVNIEKVDVKIRNYVKGAFSGLYKENEYPRDILFFQGAVHFQRICNQKELEKFIHVINPILSNSFNDDYCTREVARLLINYYLPENVKVKNSKYMKKISNMMFRWLVLEMDKTKYGVEWFTYFIRNEFTAKTYIESLVYVIGEIQEGKYERVLDIIDKNISDEIRIDSHYIRLTSGQKEELIQHSELIKILLNKDVIVQDRNFRSELESLFQDLKHDDQKEMIKELFAVLRGILTEKDYRELSIMFMEL